MVRQPAHDHRIGMRHASLVFLCGLAMTCKSAADDRRPFTVADSIAMTRLINPAPSESHVKLQHRFASMFKHSPDGKRFVVVACKGDLSTGLNEYSLLLFDAQEVLTFVNSADRTELPHHEVLTKFATASPQRDGIDQVQWGHENRTLAFIGRGSDEIGQVYVYDVQTRALRQLTHHTFDVATFDLSSTHDRLLYSAYTAPDWAARNSHGFAVGSEPVHMLTTKDPRDVADLNIEYFIADLAENRVSKVAMGPSYRRAGEIAISPSGRWAVVPNTVTRVPLRWKDYEFVKYNPMRASEAADEPHQSIGERSRDTARTEFIEFDEAFGAPDYWVTQYQLIDLESGSTRPLLDAPTKRVGADLRMIARWSPDGTHVLLPPTFLPLTANLAERRRRSRVQAIAEVEISSGIITPVIDENGHRANDGGTLTLTDFGWMSDGSVLVQFLMENSNGVGILERYRKNGRRWVKRQRSTTIHPAPGSAGTGRLRLRIAQDLGTPPEVAALDAESGRERTITDLNPQLRRLSLGRVEVFNWADRFGQQFSGGLVLPPNFRHGTKYPVVLQTSGFYPPRFLDDGPISWASPHAAQAIANKEILVLQMPILGGQPADPQSQIVNSRETDRFVAGMEGAIDALAEKGLIDRDRVGVLGFSRDGMLVHYAIAFSRYPVAAATVADSVALTPYCYAAVYGMHYPGMSEFDTDATPWYGAQLAIGAPFWGEGVQRWMERSYIYHLDRIRTPIRYEEYGLHPPCHWEAFAIQKRHHRPVEMISIPHAWHLLRPPFARYTSKQGNVDWFAFWLKGEEDSDPAKAAQYERWRKLREHQKHRQAELQTQ